MLSARYFLDLTEGELAELLSCPRGTVKSRLSRALGRLRSLLQSNDSSISYRRGKGLIDG